MGIGFTITLKVSVPRTVRNS